MADIIVDTHKLNIYAQRLANVNYRISQLDQRLDSLYTRVGLLGLWTLIQADSLTGFSWKLLRCQTYLQQTASDFDATERLLSSEDPLDFNMWHAMNPYQHFMFPFITKNEEDTRSTFAKFINNDLNTSDAVFSGSAHKAGEIGGISTAGTVSGSIFSWEAGIKNDSSFKFVDENGNLDFSQFGLRTSATASGSVLSGEAEGNIGYLHGKASVDVLTGAVKGEAKATLWEDGKFNPSLTLGVGIEGSVLKGEAEGGFGDDQYGVFGKAEGDLLHAEAGAEVGAGYLGVDENGQAQYGVKAEASAMVSAAQGKVEGGITIFGIDIGVGVTGHVGAAGGKVGGGVTTDGATLDLGGALLLGGEVNINVDWSDAEWIGESIDAVGEFIDDTTEFITDAAEDAYEFVEDVFVGASNTLDDVGDFLFGWI